MKKLKKEKIIKNILPSHIIISTVPLSNVRSPSLPPTVTSDFGDTYSKSLSITHPSSPHTEKNSKK